MIWKHPSYPVTKKFKVQRSAAKVMATVFWDAKGVILLDILPQGQCINAARCCSTLDRLKKAIHCKRPGLLRREDDLISELRNWFDNLDVDFFRVGIHSLLSRWQKCIDLHGDYVEK
ncbi:histone-lysine N-methyltransferase SETMAR [Plakobranchus ocellatus]|uniref:Histone-lysine N-methyltransferase SETMAR n=1 Tax=Plakobranchus ocellatus TaxID=259542 RepID=A0AAV3YXU0_9GAST|nr:histone-lysine N-methyltransferase SETMAR [Plakobranchus ocellatus]